MKLLSLLSATTLAACTSKSPVTPETDSVIVAAAQEYFTHAVNAYVDSRYESLNCTAFFDNDGNRTTRTNKPEECESADDRYYPPEIEKHMDDEADKAGKAVRMAITALELDDNADLFDCMEVNWDFALFGNEDPIPERNTILWEKDKRHYIETYDPMIASGPSWVTVRSTDSNWETQKPSCKPGQKTDFGAY